MANNTTLTQYLESKPVAEKLKMASGAHFGANTFAVSAVIKAVMQTTNISKCSKENVADVVREALSYGVIPDGKSSYLAVWGDTLKLSLMRSGLVNIALREKIIDKVMADVVRVGDKFEWGFENGELVTKHTPKHDGEGDITASYAICKKDGIIISAELMNAKDLQKIKAMTKGKVWTEWEGEMAKKAAIRRALKDLVQAGTMLHTAMQADDENYDFTVNTPTNAGEVIHGNADVVDHAPLPADDEVEIDG